MVSSDSPVSIHSIKIAVDNVGNVYTTGQFNGHVDFDPGPDSAYMTTPSGAINNIYISKLSNTGDFIWSKQLSGTSSLHVNGLTVSASGEVYVAGYFNNTADFDPGPKSASLTALGNGDIFVCKLTTSGDFVWVKQIGSFDYEALYSMEMDQDNNLLLTGTGSSTTDYEPGPSVLNIAGGGFLIKISQAGNLLWATSVTEIGQAIDVMADGKIIQLSNNMSSITLNLLSESGNLKWSKLFSGGYMSGGDVTHSPTGDIYLSGNFQSTIKWGTGNNETLNCSTGQNDAFIIQFDSLGNTLQAWQFVGGGSTNIQCIQFHNWNLTAVGTFNDSIDFDPGPGTIAATSQGWSDMAIFTLDSKGKLQCLSIIEGPHGEYPTSLIFSEDDKILFTGQCGEDADFDPETGSSLLNHHSNFIAKYNMCGVAASIEGNLMLSKMFCYPNPGSGIITVSVKGDWEMNIYTIEGKLVKEQLLSETQQVEVNDLANGLYTVLLRQGDKTIFQKLVISR
jgi:hypothetical protein